jgi:hypothetical protein
MPYLVCQYCKKPIYAAGGSEGYLHANSSAAECATPQLEGLKNRATPYDNNITYVAYRADLITQMTNIMFSYTEAQSPAELLQILLADARHFADVNHLAYDDHNRRSYQLYLHNRSDSPPAVQSCDESPAVTDSTASALPTTGEHE